MEWIRKHAIIFLLGLIALAASVVTVAITLYEPEEAKPAPREASHLFPATSREDTYSLKKDGDSLVFENYVDGYQVTLPSDVKLSFDRFQLRTRISFDDDAVMDIYKTQIPNEGSSAVYLQVCSGQHSSAPICFMNTQDHVIIAQDHYNRAGVSAVATQWHRRELSKVLDDKPYYYAADLAVKPYTAVSFQYKGKDPIDWKRLEVIEAIVDSYEDRKPTVGAYVRKDESKGRSTAAWNRKTAAFYKKYFSRSAPLRWGIFEPSYAAKQFGELDKLEDSLDTRFHVLVHYLDFDRSDPKEHVLPILKQAAKENRAVELTLQTNNPLGEPSHVYDVLNGEYDDYLRELAEVIKESGAVVLLRVGNEMNGDWCMYSPVHLSRDPDIYVAFYRYVIDRLEAGDVGDQMIYVWNPNAEDFPPFRWNNPHLTFPGNRYVDVVGLTSYNTGTYYEGELWRDFESMYRQPYNTALYFYIQPLMITEFACSSIGGDKVAWVEDMLGRIDEDFPELKVAIWWNHADYDPKKKNVISRPYYIDKPEGVHDAFRTYFRSHNPD